MLVQVICIVDFMNLTTIKLPHFWIREKTKNCVLALFARKVTILQSCLKILIVIRIVRVILPCFLIFSRFEFKKYNIFFI